MPVLKRGIPNFTKTCTIGAQNLGKNVTWLQLGMQCSKLVVLEKPVN